MGAAGALLTAGTAILAVAQPSTPAQAAGWVLVLLGAVITGWLLHA
jgi:hypothetical protein